MGLRSMLSYSPAMAKTAVAIRHVPFEDLGTLVPLLLGRGFSIEYWDITTQGSLTRALESELLVVLREGRGLRDCQ